MNADIYCIKHWSCSSCSVIFLKITLNRGVLHTTLLWPWISCMNAVHIVSAALLCVFVSSDWSQGPWPSSGMQFAVWCRQCGLLSLPCAGQPLGPTARSPSRKKVFPTRRRSNKRMEPPLDPRNPYPGWLSGRMVLTVLCALKATVDFQ